MPSLQPKIVSTLNLYGENTGKLVQLIAKDDKFQIKSEFDKTVVEDLHIVHNNADLSVSTKFTDVDTDIAYEIERAKKAERDLQEEYTQLVSEEKNRATNKEELLEAKDLQLSNALTDEIDRAKAKEQQLETSISFIKSNVDPAALDSLTEIVAKINDVDSSAYSRILFIENYLKNVFNLESLYPLTVADMTKVFLNIASSANIFPDEQPPTYSAEGGWHFTNGVAGEKINWYFAGQTTETKTLADYTGFYAVVKLDSVLSLPFFNVYTKPKEDGTDAGSWYGSRRVFTFPPDNNLSPGTEVLMYHGVDLPAVHPDIPHIRLLLDNGSSNGSDGDTQEFLTISFATNSAAVVDHVNLTVKAFIVGDGRHTYMELYSAPPSSSTTNIIITTIPGSLPSQLTASITTEPYGTGDIIWSQGELGALEGISVTVPTGLLHFNIHDEHEEGYSGATYTITSADGDVLTSSDGLIIGEAGQLADSFPFTA